MHYVIGKGISFLLCHCLCWQPAHVVSACILLVIDVQNLSIIIIADFNLLMQYSPALICNCAAE
eukprot:1592577-Ditylum_brightwellii.AAC.2